MTDRFTIIDTPLDGVKIIQRHPISDQRGYLERMYCVDEMATLLRGKNICQINHTSTKERGTVRGLHFQYPPNMEKKFVQCIKGSIYDVAVDLRRGSSTYLNYFATILSAENYQTMLIPEGVAHGLQTLEDDCELIYLHTAVYQPGNEGIIDVNDSHLAIEWPLPFSIISDRDKSNAIACEQFQGLES